MIFLPNHDWFVWFFSLDKVKKKESKIHDSLSLDLGRLLGAKKEQHSHTVEVVYIGVAYNGKCLISAKTQSPDLQWSKNGCIYRHKVVYTGTFAPNFVKIH